MGLSGGAIFRKMMVKHGVEHICIPLYLGPIYQTANHQSSLVGYPGGAILPVFDAIYKAPEFDFVLPRHEQGAGHMAEGYARACGKPGVVLVTSGPGATNLITPMMDALADGTPMVVFCGQVSTGRVGMDGFQEADVLGMSRSCTKWNISVRDVVELPSRINEAFQIATFGRPGPVLVELPIDVTASILQRPIPQSDMSRPTKLGLAMNNIHQRDLHSTIDRVASLVNTAKQPVLYVGQGMLASPRGPALLKDWKSVV